MQLAFTPVYIILNVLFSLLITIIPKSPQKTNVKIKKNSKNYRNIILKLFLSGQELFLSKENHSYYLIRIVKVDIFVKNFVKVKLTINWKTKLRLITNSTFIVS